MPLSSDETALICQCPVSYHTVIQSNGEMVNVLDDELPDLMTMCVGRCERCGLPYHLDDFSFLK